MARQIPYMPLFIAEYKADTEHLDTIAHGAYLLLMMSYWQRGGPLPDNDRKLRAITKLDEKSWKAVRDDVAEFFSIGDGAWHHKRIEVELVNAQARIDRAKRAGKASAEARQKRNPGSTPGSTQVNPELNASATQAPRLVELASNHERKGKERKGNQEGEDPSQDKNSTGGLSTEGGFSK